MNTLLRELRYAARGLKTNPGFALAAIVALAVGIGAPTALFSVINAVLLRPLPYAEPDRLVMLWDTHRDPGHERDRPSPGNFIDWQRKGELFDHLGVWHPGSATLRTDNGPEVVRSAAVTPNFFTMVGTPAALGRTFDGTSSAGVVYSIAERYVSGNRELVISYGLWQRRFGGDASLIGKTISVDGAPWRVLAVMPRGFAMPEEQTEVWLPWDIPQSYANIPGGVPRDWRFLHVLGRLRRGVTIDQAQQAMDQIAASLAEQYPKANGGWGVRVVSLSDEIVGPIRPALLALAGAVGFLFLVACANVAGLQLARAAARSREVAVRLALGASQGRLVRETLAESLLLAVLGGAAGVILAPLAVRFLLALQPDQSTQATGAVLDGTVLGFAVAISMIAALLSGLGPALQTRSNDITAMLADSGRSASTGLARVRLRRLVVAGEVAATFVLLAGAGLFTRSFLELRAVDPGFNPRQLLVARLSLDSSVYTTGALSDVFYRTLMPKLESIPGVIAAGGVTALPMSDVTIDFDRPYWRLGERPAGTPATADIRMATAGYFRTMGMRIVRGRGLTGFDQAGGLRVIVVNELLARRVWPGLDPVGKQLVIDSRVPYSYEVVGVVNDTRHRGLRSEPRPEIFIPHPQAPYLALNIVLRTLGDPMSIADQVRREVAAVDPSQPVHSTVTMDSLIARSVSSERFAMVLFEMLALVAVMLAVTGIYGLIAYLVRCRTREIGVRLALGATRTHLMRLIVGETARLVGAGGVMGLALSLVLAQTVRSMLYGVRAADPATFIAAAALLGLSAVVAACVPTRRALQVDPVEALRS